MIEKAGDGRIAHQVMDPRSLLQVFWWWGFEIPQKVVDPHPYQPLIYWLPDDPCLMPHTDQPSLQSLVAAFLSVMTEEGLACLQHLCATFHSPLPPPDLQ